LCARGFLLFILLFLKFCFPSALKSLKNESTNAHKNEEERKQRMKQEREKELLLDKSVINL
jgi:hypothetical protein